VVLHHWYCVVLHHWYSAWS